MANPNKDPYKDAKREQKQQRKEEKWKRKLARKKEKQARKLARKEQKIVVSYRSRLPLEKAIALIEEVLAGLKSGTISVEQEDRQLTIHPPQVVDVRVATRQTWKNEGVAFRVRWPRAKAEEDSPSIKVSGAEPQE